METNPQPSKPLTTPGADELPSRRSLLMRLVGVKRRPGKRIAFGLTRWGWVLVVLVVGIAGAAGFAEYSMQPDFCRSCHLMEPYYQAWHQSTHKGVNCTKCHFEPGIEKTLYGKWQASSQAVKYITQTYGSKPHAEIRDSSCMREECHNKRLLSGKVDWKIKTARGGEVTIKFDHTPHLSEERRGKHLRCVSCHSQIVQGQHLVVTLDTCFLCHFKGLEHGRHEKVLGGCNGCHDAPKEKIRLATGEFNHSDYVKRGVSCENCHSDSLRGDGVVPRQVCWNCHNQPAQIAKYSEPQFLHDQHVNEHKVECSACHVQIEHNLTAGATARIATSSMKNFETGTCGSCHESTHLGPAELYRGTGGRGVPDMPSPMSRAQVDCIACHKAMKQSSESAAIIGQTFVAVQDSCNYCHDTKYDGVLDVWKRQVATQLEKSEASLLEVRHGLERATLDGMTLLKLNRLLDDAEHNVRLVKLGHGVHNVNYATAVLNVAQENCRQIARVLAEKGFAGATGHEPVHPATTTPTTIPSEETNPGGRT